MEFTIAAPVKNVSARAVETTRFANPFTNPANAIDYLVDRLEAVS
jgi:hypothetical protein